ncbi:MAG: haloalkane dehalogenase [Actinomycetota bacterium]
MLEVFRTPDERFAELEGYDLEPHYLELGGDLEGLRMHHVDEGDGSPILLLHGEPTWAYLYRKMIPTLSEVARVIAPDFIGFGRSDKVTEVEWYSYDKHLLSLTQLIESLDLRDITLVVQDWGGPIGLRAAVEDEARFSRLVILNTGMFRPRPGKPPNEAFLQWLRFATENPDLPVGFIVQGATTTELGPGVIAGYEAPFVTPKSKAGAAAFPGLVPLDIDDPGAKETMAVHDALTRWEKPVLVAFSDGDPIFPPRAGERLAERIPGARFELVEGASHFLQEDKGEEIANLVEAFVRGS